VSPNLEEQLRRARQVLEQRADGHLPLPVRRQLRATWGFGDEGRLRRYWLERLAAERALAGWEAERPDDRRPQEMLELADAVAVGHADGEEAAQRAVALANELDELLDEGVDDATVYAGMAAVAAQTAARWGEEPEQLEDPDDDQDRDSDMWEGAFWASMAHAPSLPKMDVAEHVAPRREFWRWYLDEAVPTVDRALVA
jgi:Immunity protein Imm5